MQIATSSDSFTSNTRGSCTRRKKITKNNTPDSAQKVSQIQSEFSPKMGQTSPHLRHLVVVLQNSSFLIQNYPFLIQQFSCFNAQFIIFTHELPAGLDITLVEYLAIPQVEH